MRSIEGAFFWNLSHQRVVGVILMATPCELITEQMGLLYRGSQIGQYIRIQTPFLYPECRVLSWYAYSASKTI